MITTSAPGKLLLFGDHAVVYGQPCIVSAVNERLFVSVEEAETLQFVTPHSNDTRFLEAAVVVTKQKFGSEPLRVRLSTHNGFAAIKGFGSSSAVTVAAIKALAQFLQQPLSDEELFALAYETVLSVQGVGSGFDVAAAVYGGTLLYANKGQTLEHLSLNSLPIVIGYTGVKADTTSLIKDVAQKRLNHPEKVDRIFAAIGKLVLQAKEKLLEGDWERVGKLMDFNQDYLRDLGVSCEKLEDLISAAKNAGAYGAKLSGAGGGDCMITVVSEAHRGGVETAIQAAGGEVISLELNAPGVTSNNL